MAPITALASRAALRGSTGAVVVPGQGRGNRTRIVLDLNDALEPCIEGIALADEALAAVNRIVAAALAGSRHAVTNEAGRLGYKASQYRAEFARIAGSIEGPDGDAA